LHFISFYFLILLPLCCAVRFDTAHIKRIWYGMVFTYLLTDLLTYCALQSSTCKQTGDTETRQEHYTVSRRWRHLGTSKAYRIHRYSLPLVIGAY